MDITLLQEKDNLDVHNILKLDEIEYQKYIKDILEIYYDFNLNECTFFHAVDIFKRVINIDIEIDIKLLYKTSIYIASKFNDYNYLEANFSEYDKKKIIKSEIYILTKLNFDIYKPNVYTYYYYIQNKLNYKNTLSDKISLCILEYFSTDLNIIEFSNCVFAISAIQISYTLINYERNIHSELGEIKYQIKEIENCIKYIKNKFDLLRKYTIDNNYFRIKYLIILRYINKWVTF